MILVIFKIVCRKFVNMDFVGEEKENFRKYKGFIIGLVKKIFIRFLNGCFYIEGEDNVIY